MCEPSNTGALHSLMSLWTNYRGSQWVPQWKHDDQAILCSQIRPTIPAHQHSASLMLSGLRLATQQFPSFCTHLDLSKKCYATNGSNMFMTYHAYHDHLVRLEVPPISHPFQMHFLPMKRRRTSAAKTYLVKP